MSVATKIARRKGWAVRLDVTADSLKQLKEDLLDESFAEEYDDAIDKALEYLKGWLEPEKTEFDEIVEDCDCGGI